MKKKAILAAALCVSLGLGGCSLGKSSTNIAAGMQCIKDRDFTGAEEAFTAALEAGEDEKQALRGQGIALMGKADYEGAASAFEQALSCSSGIPEDMDYDINYYLAACYMKLSEPAKAEAAYDAIIALRKTDAEAYELRGAVKLSQDRYEEAKADFDKAVSLEPTDYTRMIQILETMTQYGHQEDGQAYLSEAIASHGEEMSDYDRGRLYYYLGDYDSACVSLEKARSDTDYQSTMLLGRTYEALGDYNYALSVYQAYLANDQTHPEIYNQLGLCQMAMGSYQDALTSFQTGLKAKDNTVLQSLSFNEIVAYEHLGEFKKASVLMDTYLENYPGDETAAREAEFLKTR